MAWYTTDHARRDAARQAEQRKLRDLLDTAQSSNQVTGYERINHSAEDCIAYAARKAEALETACKARSEDKIALREHETTTPAP